MFDKKRKKARFICNIELKAIFNAKNTQEDFGRLEALSHISKERKGFVVNTKDREQYDNSSQRNDCDKMSHEDVPSSLRKKLNSSMLPNLKKMGSVR